MGDCFCFSHWISRTFCGLNTNFEFFEQLIRHRQKGVEKTRRQTFKWASHRAALQMLIRFNYNKYSRLCARRDGGFNNFYNIWAHFWDLLSSSLGSNHSFFDENIPPTFILCKLHKFDWSRCFCVTFLLTLTLSQIDTYQKVAKAKYMNTKKKSWCLILQIV